MPNEQPESVRFASDHRTGGCGHRRFHLFDKPITIGDSIRQLARSLKIADELGPDPRIDDRATAAERPRGFSDQIEDHSQEKWMEDYGGLGVLAKETRIITNVAP